MRTLYVTGWCVSRQGKEIRAVRARIGRQRFAGNYGIARKDVGAALERIGFAIAVPLRRGKSQVITRYRSRMACGEPFRSELCSAPRTEIQQAPVDPKYFVPNPGANPRIEFWIDRPVAWPKKVRGLKISGWCLAISGDEITEVRARVRKNIFPARFGKLRPDIGSRYDNDQARSGAVFHSMPPFRLGAASS